MDTSHFWRRIVHYSVLLWVCLLSLAACEARANILESITNSVQRLESPSKQKGGASCQRLKLVSSPSRAGHKAFKHTVDRCGERVEFAGRKTKLKIGKTYWYGWSLYIPDWGDNDPGFDIVNQWTAYPTHRNFRLGCGAAGTYMVRNGDSLVFKLQRPGSSDIKCTQYHVAKVSELRGKWVDFVMQAKWTGNSNGFLKLWRNIGGSSYQLVVNYSGKTFWNDEGNGPYFKMGLYKGDPNFKGPAPRTVYTDEYRLGDDRSSFEEVAPGTHTHIPTIISE